MTDTARTIAELQALFADNTTGAISEQDLRDFVESWGQAKDGRYDDRVFGSYSVTATTVVNNSSTPVDMGGTAQSFEIFEDPQGWADPDPYVSDWYSDTFPANSSLQLPPGFYTWQIVARITADPDPASYLTVQPDYLDTIDAYPSPLTDGVDALYGGDLYLMGLSTNDYLATSAKISSAVRTATKTGSFRIPNHRRNGDPVTTIRVGFAWYLIGDTSNRTVLYNGVAVTKMA